MVREMSSQLIVESTVQGPLDRLEQNDIYTSIPGHLRLPDASKPATMPARSDWISSRIPEICVPNAASVDIRSYS